MDKLKMHSRDKVKENIAQIAALFPNAVTETIQDGKVVQAIDFDILKQELSEVVVEGPQERYQFTWPGKRRATLIANSPIAKTLRPWRNESVEFDTTENLYIEGDNLDALKLMQETYLGQVKMIYIDPPYNTGKDFVYKDNFKESKDDYLPVSGQFDDEGGQLVQNPESNGRFHSDWLSMMYSRLVIARNLLCNDGVIFISIDDTEQPNLRKICDLIFGEPNFIENYIWESTFRPDNSSTLERENSQHIIAYSKNKKNITKLIGKGKVTEGLPSLTKNSMSFSVLTFPPGFVETTLSDGIYKSGDFTSGYSLLNDVHVKNGLIENEFSLKGRVIWSQDYLNRQIKSGTKIIIKNTGFIPYSKKPNDGILAPTSIIPKDLVGDVLSGRAEIAELIGKNVFDYPKPVSLLEFLIQSIDSNEGIYLDFFSGSATMAHAVIKRNSMDNGKRKFIMVQLPEETDRESESYKAGYKDICDIGKERIRRAGQKIKQESGLLGQDLDIGFRVLKVDSTNMQDVYYSPSEYKQSNLLALAENIKPDRTAEDLLFQIMLDLGILLSSPIHETLIEGKKVFNVADGYLLACFDNEITDKIMTEIAKQKPYYAIFRDSSLADDSVAANFEQIFATYSLTTVRKVL
jgi:adenine-specific DNA-methyltransferase